MMGRSVHYVCADDTHGTPIMLAAEKAGISPEQFIAAMQASHEADFAAFHVDFDHYDSTHSPLNRELTEVIYAALDAGGHIARRSISQFYDPVKAMFLPDRYIKGDCPNCGTADQYGDNCEHCGATYAPTELKNPRSVVSGATPELRDSEHYLLPGRTFRNRSCATGWPATWRCPGSRPSCASGWTPKAACATGTSRAMRPISASRSRMRRASSSTSGWTRRSATSAASRPVRANGLDFDAFLLRAGSEAELHHFIGKDIVNFHGLFWPAVLHGAGYRLPTALHVNGYLTVNGAKMSKSRGTFIHGGRTYLDVGLDEPEALRYYLTARPSPPAAWTTST
jgi:methionyl-tRNA synthetase